MVEKQLQYYCPKIVLYRNDIMWDWLIFFLAPKKYDMSALFENESFQKKLLVAFEVP